MSQLDTYLFFNGNCAEAMRFYERTLGGKIEMMMTAAESPDPSKMPPGPRNPLLPAGLAPGGAIRRWSSSFQSCRRACARKSAWLPRSCR